ncbi:MAG: glutamate-5-semialdehyde dehydrogenase, partial [Rhodospirillales bacterium]|nr:glutamate-5-semialdehyde dehydrogenase [Rhodospirillales bacterium]
EFARILGTQPAAIKDQALEAAAAALRESAAQIITENNKDMAAGGQKGLSAALLDRLKLDEDRIEDMARGLDEIALLDDPVGQVMDAKDRPNGLNISRVRVPLGVIGIIYESRPNVTADAGALCLKAGNASILRGGSESFYSSTAIHACLMQGLEAAGLPPACIQMVPTRDRAAVGAMLGLADYIDVIVPRGGKSLIERVQTEAKVPVFAHLEGICHTYVDAAANSKMAQEVVLNAKMRRTGICGATETLLIDERVAPDMLPGIVDRLVDAGCELRGDASSQRIDPRIDAALDEDWDTEYLEPVISVRQVSGVQEAMEHIHQHGSEHTDAIITEDAQTAEIFLNNVNSAIVMHNTSTQFADGGEFGMGAEIGISTGRLHARGPVGLEQLTTFKYVVRGNGQVRP